MIYFIVRVIHRMTRARNTNLTNAKLNLSTSGEGKKKLLYIREKNHHTVNVPVRADG